MSSAAAKLLVIAKDINVSINQPKFIAVLGKNGIGKSTLLIKPELDTRELNIKSRNGLEETCSILNENTNIELLCQKYDIILVDEAQFLSVKQVDMFREISINKNKIIYLFGLKTDFKGNLFEGSKRLIEVADKIEELSTLCLCGEKATMNLKYDNKTGNILKEGNTIDCGYKDMYMSVCFKHFTFKNINDFKL